MNCITDLSLSYIVRPFVQGEKHNKIIRDVKWNERFAQRSRVEMKSIERYRDL